MLAAIHTRTRWLSSWTGFSPVWAGSGRRTRYWKWSGMWHTEPKFMWQAGEPGLNTVKPIVFALALLVLAFPARLHGQTATLTEKQKIEGLIKIVGQLKSAKFLRNGWSYSSDTAAYFLRKKWEANDSGIKTARDFIDKVATVSGTSGTPYLVRMKDGRELESRTFLLAELNKLEGARTEVQISAP